MSNIQILVVSSNDERKQRLQRQFAELNITFHVRFVEGYTPLTNADYLPPEPNTLSDLEKKAICCSRSHIRAINCAADESSPEFSLIVEDDVGFHRTDFVPIMKYIIENWDSVVGSSRMLSVGWIAMQNYEQYTSDTPYTKCVHPNYRVLRCFYAGAQAYIIKKESAQWARQYINAQTYEGFVNNMNASKLPYISDRSYAGVNLMHADGWINYMFSQVALFPMLAVEQRDTLSLLGAHGPGGNHPIWDNFFKGFEEERAKYWSY
jgi:GR25 family glycosyltransferase involved in LPS biosynthesis